MTLHHLKIYGQAVENRTSAMAARVGEVSCHAGCSACCAQMVAITLIDAFRIAVHLLRTHPALTLEGLVERLQEDTKYQLAYDPFEYFALKRKCTFLGDSGDCTIYEVRPVNCRQLVVKSPSAWCDPDNVLAVSRGESTLQPDIQSSEEFHGIAKEGEIFTRQVLDACGLKGDLPPAPMAPAVLAAIYTLKTGRADAILTWASEPKRA